MPGWVHQFKDSFESLLSGLGVFGRDKGSTGAPRLKVLNIRELSDLYRGDWLARKIVDIPAFDSSRAWRTWTADKDKISAIEETEREFGLQRKVMEGMTKARLFGGAALVLGVDGTGPWNEEIDLDKVKRGSLKFIHAVERWMITPGPVIRDITNPWFGEPEYYQRSNTPVIPAPGGVETPKSYNLGQTGGAGATMFIHPSRVVRFIGLNYPDTEMAPDCWGDSVLQPIYDAIRDASMVSQAVAACVAEMKVDVIKVPGLSNTMSTDQGAQDIGARWMRANAAKSVINALLIDQNEELTRLFPKLEGAPQLLQMYLLMAAAAADIPSTRLLSREPSGQNATGDSDTTNYYDRLSSDQKVRITPTLSRLDEIMLRHIFGRRDKSWTYDWNPLWQLSDDAKSKINLANSQSFQIDNSTALIPPEVLQQARLSQLIKDGVYPGLDQAMNDYEDEMGEGALAEHAANSDMPEPEAPPPEPGEDQFGQPGGGGPPQQKTPQLAASEGPASNVPNAPKESETSDAQSALVFQVSGGGMYRGRKRRKLRVQKTDYRRLTNDYARFIDASNRSLYIYRPLLNADEFSQWARDVGFGSLVVDPHVTILYSKQPCDWSIMGESVPRIVVPPDLRDDARRVVRLGDQGAIVLLFNSYQLSSRHDWLVGNGASHDYTSYQPHVTVTYSADPDFDVTNIEPWRGPLEFGAEQWQEITPNSRFVAPAEDPLILQAAE